MSLTEQSSVSLSEQLRQDLSAIVARLNERRGLFDRLRGERYELSEEDELYGVEFKILARNREGRGRPIAAEITLKDGEYIRDGRELSGFVAPDKKYSPVRNYVHAFSHQHNIPLTQELSHFLFLMD